VSARSTFNFAVRDIVMPIVRGLFFFTGRIDRSSWWCGIVFLSVVTWAVNAAPQVNVLPEMLLAEAWYLASIWPLLALVTKRFNDRGWPLIVPVGFALIYLNPLLPGIDAPVAWLHSHHPEVLKAIVWAIMGLYLLVLIDNGFLKGTPGANRWGPNPYAELEANEVRAWAARAIARHGSRH
jgi:uncharacterized membrane protein YhaH (DUF805 family)